MITPPIALFNADFKFLPSSGASLFIVYILV